MQCDTIRVADEAGRGHYLQDILEYSAAGFKFFASAAASGNGRHGYGAAKHARNCWMGISTHTEFGWVLLAHYNRHGVVVQYRAAAVGGWRTLNAMYPVMQGARVLNFLWISVCRGFCALRENIISERDYFSSGHSHQHRSSIRRIAKYRATLNTRSESQSQEGHLFHSVAPPPSFCPSVYLRTDATGPGPERWMVVGSTHQGQCQLLVEETCTVDIIILLFRSARWMISSSDWWIINL